MSTSKVKLAGRKRKPPSRKPTLIRRLSGLAVICVVGACGWVIYSNILAANVYPSLGSAGYDEPVVKQPKLVHHLERRGMDRVAAKIAQEVGMLLEHRDVDAGAREQKAEHHAGRPAVDDAAAHVGRGHTPMSRSLAM